MAAWRLDGKPRTARRFTVYKNCPLPTPEDRLFFILVYLKTYALQVVQGRLFGMGQSKANQWIHVLLPVLLAALRTLGDAPARSLTALAQRLGVSEADAATWSHPLEEEPAPVATSRSAASPLLPMTAPNGASSAPKTLLNRRSVIAARKKTTRSKMSCWSMPCSSSSFSVTPMAAASMISALPTRRPIPCPRGAGCCRIWASWRSRCPQVEILMPTKKPRGQELTREQQRANQALHQRRLRIEHVNSSVKRCRIVKDRIRLWKEGVRDLVMELCCALHNFRVRLTPGNQWFNRDKLNVYTKLLGLSRQQIIDAAGVKRVPLPPRSPNLNAYAERWVRSVKEECLSRLILFGEASLRHALTQYVEHFHHERNHQGKGNVLLFPAVSQDAERAGPIQCRERLGGS